MGKYLKQHMVDALKDHVLEEIPSGERLRVFEMHRPGSHFYFLQIVFSPSGIVLMGDLTIGGRRGIVGDAYPLDWFAGKLEEDYLCSKFLHEEWQREVAIKWVRSHIKDIEAGEHDDVVEKRVRFPSVPIEEKRRDHIAVWEELERDLAACSVEDAITFGGELQHRGYDFDDLPGMDYPLADAGWLVAVQKKFSELYPKLVVAR